MDAVTTVPTQTFSEAGHRLDELSALVGSMQKLASSAVDESLSGQDVYMYLDVIRERLDAIVTHHAVEKRRRTQ